MNPPASVARTARERARAELTREIKEEARRQLAGVGADALSLRAVARELGMVSSALYRYYPSKDDLLTALIIDAYNAIGEAAETAIAAAAPGTSPSVASQPASAPSAPPSGASGRDRWIAACHAIRAWAVANPHEYALIYGSPVPGYRAPEATIGPAARTPLAFVSVLRDALASGELTDADTEAATASATGAIRATGPGGTDTRVEPKAKWLPADGPLSAQAAALSAALALEGAPAVPGYLLVRAMIAWTQLFGMLSFELFGQFVGSFEPADAFFGYAATQLAAFAGLT
jgi:AcrR family transcriptional regulator